MIRYQSIRLIAWIGENLAKISVIAVVIMAASLIASLIFAVLGFVVVSQICVICTSICFVLAVLPLFFESNNF